MVAPDETYTDKLARLIETIEGAQGNIKEVVDQDTVSTNQGSTNL